jgi:hypothetical protein
MRDETVVWCILGAVVLLYAAHVYYTQSADAVDVGITINPNRSQILGAAGVDPFDRTSYTTAEMAAGTGL